MNDKWMAVIEKVLDTMIVVGVTALTMMACFGAVVAGVAAIRYIFCG